MKFVNKHKNVELIIPRELFREIEEYCQKYYPHEFGGFLIGYYSEDLKKLFITNCLLPLKFKGFPSSFERNTDGIIKTLMNYLGVALLQIP